jgi:hypothetical protein
MALKLLNKHLNYADKVFCVTLAGSVGEERLNVSKGISKSFDLERLGHDLGCLVSQPGLRGKEVSSLPISSLGSGIFRLTKHF